ncbi:MAG TPA: VWA domain-containing protein [Thermoanaerobaculia bacterium]|nr:VWA domain-containing protein [Thermoanaerobaculia bacterium]
MRHALLALLLLASPSLQAQDARFADEMDVEVVNLDVNVVGEDGAPVSGLTVEDFAVLDDGQPVQVTHFTPFQAEAAEAAAPTHLVLLFDDAEIEPADRGTAFARVRMQLDRLLGPNDRVLVARQGAGLQIEQPFTSDRALVEEALKRLERASPGVPPDVANRRAVLSEIRMGDAAGANALGSAPVVGGEIQKDTEQSAATSLASVRSYAASRRDHALRSLAALDRLVSALTGLPGRKAILLVSAGYDLRPGDEVYQAWLVKYRATRASRGSGSVDMEQPGLDIRRAIKELGAGASASQVTLYAATRGSEARPEFRESGKAAAETPAESLRLLAESTGGAVVFNLEGIERLAERLESDLHGGYSLGYPLPHPADGAWHSIEIRVRRPGARVQAASGYRARSQDQRTQDRAAAALLLGLAENPLDLGVDLGTGTRERDGTYTVPVTLKVPLARLMLLPKGSGHEGHLSIFLLTQGTDGGLSSGGKMEAPVRIENAKMVEAMGQTGVYQANLRVRPGAYRVGVAVRDDVAALESAVSVDLVIKDEAGKKGKRGKDAG